MAPAYSMHGVCYLPFRRLSGAKRRARRAPDSHQDERKASDLALMADRAARVAEIPDRAVTLSPPVRATVEILRTVAAGG